MSSEYSPERLRALQRRAFDYFLKHHNPENGLVTDKSCEQSGEPSPASIAVVGFALSCYCVAVENGWMKRQAARDLTLAALRFFCEAEQSTSREATGYQGFYYHFIDMKNGRRAWNCELSTMDSALLLIGFLMAAQYFDRDTKDETELRERAEFLIARADWSWATHDAVRVALSWKPERLHANNGFQKARWGGYNESLLMMILALGTQGSTLTKHHYDVWCSSYQWKKIYGSEFLYAGPLFIHQFPQLWLDLRDLRDEFMQRKNCDYYQNSQRAIAVQQEYCRRNPRGFADYSQQCWGLSASDGPGKTTKTINGQRHEFWGYRARGVPYGPDDGTLSPWAVVASLPFAPQVVLPSLHYIESTYPAMSNHFGLHCSFNPTFGGDCNAGWVAPEYFGLDQGPMVLAIENHLTGFVWNLLRENKILQRGLKVAGFKNAKRES